ncbi:hypothetical protein OBBRIDRAFT_728644 [Obba rivulosa]|uniref:ZZ-type domain-containing protein n=1 Tax=Obba rivulosa TaxID=1052685 RepID=A0A8E2AUY8_9APHY|nr:hypothetical protein OBBRIDRAFT_728644 [Obba rivulosa]
MGPDNARGAESLPPLSVVYGDSSDQDSRPGTPLSEDDDRSDTSDHILEVSPPSPRDVDLCSQCGDTLEIVRYVCSTCGAGASSVDSRSDGTQNVEEQSYQLCSRCVQSPPGLAHALEMGLTRGKSPDPSAENDQLSLSERRRSAPRQKGQLRHAYIEQSWGQNGWQDIEQENSHSVSCSTCGTAVGLHHYRCTSCHAFDLCRACYSRVHEIHPSHAFLVVRPDTGSEVLPSQLTISDELEYMVHVGVKCVHCLGDIIGSRFHCAVCPSVDICSSCELAGLPGNLDSEDGGHNSSHILIKIPYPSNPSELQALNRRSSEQHWLNGAGAESLRANLLPRHNSAVAGTDHGILCASCNLSIQGVRYQCAMCPTSPTAFSLCSRCEERSYIVHDPMHVFFKLPRPVDRPLQSGFRMSAKLYLWPAGPDGGAYDPAYPTGYLAGLAHTYSVCDHCMQRITGIWFHCAFCPVDLCEDCEKFDEHNNTHVFILFKSTVSHLLHGLRTE